MPLSGRVLPASFRRVRTEQICRCRHTDPPTITCVGSQSASRLKSLARAVYDAQAGGRSPLLDGPWWLGATLAIAVAVYVFTDSPWKWLSLPFLVLLSTVPWVIRWTVALSRILPEFRKGLRP